METKTVYRYDEQGYLVGSLTLDDSDRAPVTKQFNIPANCTEVAPLTAKDGFKIKWTGSAWEYEEIPVEPEPEVKEPTLEELKTQKLAELNGVTQRKITGGFDSRADDCLVRYDSDIDTQSTMQGIGVNSDSVDSVYPEGVPVRGYDYYPNGELAPSKLIHYLTGNEVKKWCADLSLHIGMCKQWGWQKQADIKNCESKEALDKIILE